MKKQLLRYRRKAEQRVGRANKNEVLNEELLQIERRLEHVRIACSSVYKRISQCLQSNGPDLDKRLKKLPETAVAHAMQEAGNQLSLDSDSALQKSLKVCAEAETGVAKERALYEMFVEGHVVGPLNILVETEIPNIQKIRDRLKRLVLDRDNAHQAWQKAHKAQYNPGANLQVIASKADALREEMDQAVARMELCKDQLITELFEFVSKEGTYAQHITDYVSKELEYHRRCVAHLEKLEPELKAAQENASVRSSYGSSLAEHLRVTEREIAAPIETCITCLVETGIYEEGLFRIAGGAAKLKKFRALADAGVTDLAEYDAHDDIHAVSGALKQYLRELPDPLLTQSLYQDWLAVASISDNDAKLQEIWSVIDRLPSENKANLRYLIKFCSVLADKQEYNKMSPGNIALVLSPNLLWAPNDDITANMMVSNSVAGIIESMILYADYFFPGAEPEFTVPPPPQSMDKSQGHGRTLSSASIGDGKLSTAAPNNQHQPRSPTHSRNSSSDTGIILNHSSTQANDGTRHKKKKPAPPVPIGHSSKRSSPPVPDGVGMGDVQPVHKPPIATKRTSMRQRPSMPPPEPPENMVKNGTNMVSDSSQTPHPRQRPKPPMRKKVPSIPENPTGSDTPKSTSFNDDFPPPITEEDYPSPMTYDTGHDSPPMLDLPPPPLQSEIEESIGGPGLLSELSHAEVVTAPLAQESSDEEESGVIVTSL